MLRDVFRSDLLERLNLFAWSPCCLLFACWLACLLRVSLRFGFQLVSQDVFLIATCRFCSRVGLCKCYPLCMRIRLSTGLSVLVCVCVCVSLSVCACVCVCVCACVVVSYILFATNSDSRLLYQFGRAGISTVGHAEILCGIV